MTSVLITLALSAGAHSDTQTSRRLCKTLTSFSWCKCPALFQGENRPADAKLLCLFQETHCFNKQLSCLAILLLVSGCQSVSKNWQWWEDKTAYSLTELHCSSAQLLMFPVRPSNKQKLIKSTLPMQQYLKSHPVLSKAKIPVIPGLSNKPLMPKCKVTCSFRS